MPKFAPFVLEGTVTTDASGDWTGTISDVVGATTDPDDETDAMEGYITEVEIGSVAGGADTTDLTMKRLMTGSLYGPDLLGGQGANLDLDVALDSASIVLSPPRLIGGGEIQITIDEGGDTKTYFIRIYCDGRGMQS